MADFFPDYNHVLQVLKNERPRRLPLYEHHIDLPFISKAAGRPMGLQGSKEADYIALGIDAKHSNEDQIAPFEKWIDLYNDRIGLFGGIDVNTLCLNGYDDVYREVLEKGARYRRKARGYGIGSGNSIPEYVPVDGFLAMVEAVKEIRRRETRDFQGIPSA
jgi:uroporphyrinogen-III decarboxylase